MSQSQELWVTTQLPPPIPVTWLNGLGSRLSLMPSVLALDCSWVISEEIQSTPVAYGRLKVSAWPIFTPAPHSDGFVHVVLPFGTTFQPWLVSRSLALVGLYGTGPPCLPWADRYWVDG